ncbi:MAG: hypothetical protein JW748_08375 [Anaerolineales bacterium]|nr:hypothetical protein [Anaerolineales bacterium]
MDPVSKSAALNCLEKEWPGFIVQFESLAPEAKEKFLQRQGFENFSALLAHISAWWGEAIANIRDVVRNPDVELRTYDVDRFNREAVRAAAGKSGKEVALEFEETRKRLLRAVSEVDEALISNPEMQKQLYWMITNHYAEHQG